MCEYCDEKNTPDNLKGSDGIIYCGFSSDYYLYAEHFRGEVFTTNVYFCCKCGRKLVSK